MRVIGWTIAAALGLLWSGIAAAQTAAELIEKARTTYYSLHSKGVSSFKCAAQPNWDALAAQMAGTNPQQAEHVKRMLKLLTISVEIPSEGSPKVTPVVAPGASAQDAAALAQVSGGIQQMLSGFFDSWSPFILTSPLPRNTAGIEVTEQAGQYKMTYPDGGARVTVMLEKDATITDMRIESAAMNGIFRPRFISTPDGLMLASYDAEFDTNPGGRTTVQVNVTYQAVSGVQLPKTLILATSVGGQPIRVDLEFTGCTVTRR